MATDMMLATVALHGLSRLGAASSPPQAAHVITQISHAAFAAGMHTAFLAAAAVALARAILALVVRPGNGTPEPFPAI
jgi:hypothetical protein